MSKFNILTLAAAGAAAILLTSTANADRLITKNGRSLEGKVTKKDKVYHIKLQTAELEIHEDLVKEVVIEGDMSDYVPKDAKEKEMLEKGFVKYRNGWMKKEQYQAELAKENAKRKKILEEEAKHLQFADGWKFETKHFTFQGNCPKPILDDLASLLEEYYEYMNKHIGMKASAAAKKKMLVQVYRDSEDYQKSGGAPGGTAGYFSDMQETLNFYYVFDDESFTRYVMLHEGTHLLTYLANPKFEPPSWINEGMAEYFGSARVTGERGKRKMEPGQLLDNRLLLLQEMEKERYIPLDKWLAYSSSYAETSNNKGNVYEHYAYWWGFCHFACTNKKYSQKFFAYFRDLYNLQGFEAKTGYGGLATGGISKSVDAKHYTEKLLTYLGVKDIKKLDEEFRAWIKAQESVGARGYFVVGRDFVFAGKFDEALEKLTTAIDKGYDTAETFAYRSRAWMRKGQRDKAVADLRQAIQRNPVEADYRDSLSFYLSMNKSTKAEAIEQLKIACELDPYSPWLQSKLKDMLAEDTEKKE
ncbi:MAG: tetratricopeptide repeat protein [Planctomycetota bacterium]